MLSLNTTGNCLTRFSAMLLQLACVICTSLWLNSWFDCFSVFTNWFSEYGQVGHSISKFFEAFHDISAPDTSEKMCRSFCTLFLLTWRWLTSSKWCHTQFITCSRAKNLKVVCCCCVDLDILMLLDLPYISTTESGRTSISWVPVDDDICTAIVDVSFVAILCML